MLGVALALHKALEVQQVGNREPNMPRVPADGLPEIGEAQVEVRRQDVCQRRHSEERKGPPEPGWGKWLEPKWLPSLQHFDAKLMLMGHQI